MSQREDLLGRLTELTPGTEAHRSTYRSIQKLINAADYAGATSALDALEQALHPALAVGGGGSGILVSWLDQDDVLGQPLLVVPEAGSAKARFVVPLFFGDDPPDGLELASHLPTTDVPLPAGVFSLLAAVEMDPSPATSGFLSVAWGDNTDVGGGPRGAIQWNFPLTGTQSSHVHGASLVSESDVTNDSNTVFLRDNNSDAELTLAISAAVITQVA